jgi:hypothetical protein
MPSLWEEGLWLSMSTLNYDGDKMNIIIYRNFEYLVGGRSAQSVIRM